MQAGDLKWRVGFYRRVEVDDGAGSTQGEYDDKPFLVLRANLRPRLGGEGTLAGRLTGTNLVNITIRQSDNARLVTTNWRVRDERTHEEYNIRSIVDPDGKRQWLEVLCEQGVAT